MQKTAERHKFQAVAIASKPFAKFFLYLDKIKITDFFPRVVTTS